VNCAFLSLVKNKRGSEFWLCERSRIDSRFRKYPPQPVRNCQGFQQGNNQKGKRPTDPEVDRTEQSPIQNMKNPSIDNIILDLGGVLYAIDVDRMIARFQTMLKPGVAEVHYSKEAQHEMFDRLETGMIGIEEFADGMMEAYDLAGPRERVIEAWHALLVGVIPGRVEAVRRLAERKAVVLLSNTNRYHYEALYPECRTLFEPMERCFLSFEMGMRKPDPAIFEAVIQEMNWEASRTLMVDDAAPNIEGAKKAGLQGWFAGTEEDFQRLVATYGV
jgi:putative hydrolase of the HAD superfamily